MNRRSLLLLTAASACPLQVFATIPPPPSSPWYLMFIIDGVYQVSGLRIIDMPYDVGDCRTYNRFSVDAAVRANFNYTGRTGLGVWHMLRNAPTYRWWEVLDLRNGRYIKLYELDRIEVRFRDNSRVKVVYRGPYSGVQFDPLVGTERLPDGTRLYPLRDGDRRGTLGGTGKGRDGPDSTVTPVKPTVYTFSWHWSSQETPW